MSGIDLDPGDHFTAEVKTVLRSGLGVAQYNGYDINIGYVTCDEDTSVALQYLGQSEYADNDVRYAICLDEDVLADNNDEWVEGKMDSLIPDTHPGVGKVSYVEIDEIDERNLGIAILDGKRIDLGPVRASVGTLVRIVGAENDCAEVRTESARGDNYEVRFNILARRFDELPVAEGDEVTTTISNIDGGMLVGYVGDVPIRFQSDEAELGQKVDGRIVGFERDMVLGEILETYDEVGRIAHAGHWARMQWLEQAGYGEDAFRTFAENFVGVSASALPDRDDQLRDTLIAEAIRLGLRDKTKGAGDDYPETHISGLRHWVVHKLAAVLGDPSEDTDSQEDDDPTDAEESDWFRDVMSARTGPTVTFYGDVLQLSQGYYAPAPTRVVMTDDSTGILVSGDPSQAFLDDGFELEFRGITRIVTNTSREELAANGIPTQSPASYIGINDERLQTEADLGEFIDTREQEDWQPESSWEPYTGHRYGFQDDGDPQVATLGDGRQLSLWRVPVEYGADSYQLKIEPTTDKTAQMVGLPNRAWKHVSLLLDAASGTPQQIEINSDRDAAILSCEFAPPRAQMRWLHAIGARWIDSPTRRLEWEVPPAHIDSITDVFGVLPVQIINNASPSP